MASCSNSEFQALYDIFLSFRGLDTRKKFTDHLYEALKREGFQTFRDDDEIERGENIKSELQKAIWNSRMSIIVLSKNYAYSTACLFEIQTIIEHRKRKSDHFILPVFYEVDPWEIKEQAKKLVFRGKKVTGEEVEGQRAVLKEVASMAGMVSGNQSNGYEAKFIEEIVGVLKRKQACFHLRVADHQELEKNMQNLKRKVEYLSGQEIDINEEIRSHPGRRQKHEVEIWRRDVWLLKDDVQRLEPQLVGERNVSSSALLGKHIIEKIQEATELQEKRKAFNHVLVDELPTGRLLIPPTKDFVESTKARNTENVLECLMNDDIRQIGVWGMGGIGKTTIMKHIHNKLNKEKGKFKTAYWVTVSKAFSVTKLQCDMDIAMALNLRFQDEQDESHETIRASKLYEKLSEIENYVLILDDLWEAFPLEKVGIPEPTESNGCKIVLTTRSLDVCRKMDCTTVKVELLTEQEALTLFLRKVAGNDTVLTPDVEVIAAKIARECACLPLAIVTIGGSLLGLKGIHEWRNALYELISSTKEATDGESVVFEKLKFSYSHLGNKVLQDCFLYCSLYPEDRLIPVNELIEYWIAEGLIGERDSVQAEFDKGQTILGKLTRSCLLESIPSRGCGEYVKMHDLIRDMAIRITTSSPRFMVKAGKRIKSIPYEHWFADLERISFMYSSIIELPIRPPVCLQLTTLLLKEIQIHELPDNLFTNMCCLEVLDLSQNIMRSLPESISNLENLRALRLVNSFFLEYVPSVEKLKALKEFKLTTSRIQEVPKGIEELVNIRKLDLSGNRQLGTFPSWKVRRLSKLQYLRTEKTKVEVSAEDLLCLRQLNVVSVRFHNVQELTRYVTSHQFQGLEYYCLMVGENHSLVLLDQGKKCYINFKSVAYGSGVDQLELPAGLNIFQLDGFHDPISLSAIPWLKNAKDLGRCKICYCNGLEFIFSSSIFSKDGQISLGTVKELDLFFLPRFRGLFDGIAPPHGIYFDLKALSFWGCPNVKKIFSVQLFQNFPNLETLRVGDCKNVEDIIVETAEMSCRGNHQDYTNSISLPKLKTLLLIDLPRLKCVYNGVMVCPSIEKVDVGNCPMLRRLPLALHSDQATAPPALKVIFAEKEWWESLEWDDPLTKTILQPYVGKYYG